MNTPRNAPHLAALADEPVDWRFKGLPTAWAGRTPAEIVEERLRLFDGDGPLGPVCVLSESAVAHNLATMASWCAERGVELAPHGKTHMAPQLLARQFSAGACAVTAATVSQVRVFRVFGFDRFVIANEVTDPAGLTWLAHELDADPGFDVMCWVDSVAGAELMTAALQRAGARRRLDVCVEVGMDRGRTGCRTVCELDAVARAVVDSPRLRLVGVAGYEAATGQEVTPEAIAGVRAYLGELRAAVLRLAGHFETDDVVVTAGGSTYFDHVADALTGDWPSHLKVRTILRSGCYLTHDDGLYARTSPLAFRAALRVWGQVVSQPEPGLALVAMGRRDVSFDQGMPTPTELSGGFVEKLNDQHAFVRPGPHDAPAVGTWCEFGISHPCTTFDRWQLIPVLDDDGIVVDLVRTFF